MARGLTAEEMAGYDHVPPADRERARLVLVPWLPPGTGGMTLGRVVLLRGSRAGDRELVAHELVHVEQWRRLGLVGFTRLYVSGYVRGLVVHTRMDRTRSGFPDFLRSIRGSKVFRWHREAYLGIPLEVEARSRTAEWTGRRGSGDQE